MTQQWKDLGETGEGMDGLVGMLTFGLTELLPSGSTHVIEDEDGNKKFIDVMPGETVGEAIEKGDDRIKDYE